MSTDDIHRFHQEEPLNQENPLKPSSFEGTGNKKVDKLIANTVQRSVELLSLLRDVATVLGLRDSSDAKTIRRLKEYAKAGMKKSVYLTMQDKGRK